jgi:hypothetical protein
MKILYLDIFSGISGDMFVAALIDLGVEAAQLEAELGKLSLPGYHLHVSRRQKSGIEGVKFDVHLAHDHEHNHNQDEGQKGKHRHPPSPRQFQFHSHSHDHGHSHGHNHSHSHEHGQHRHSGGEEQDEEGHRDFAAIKKLIGASTLSDWVKEKSVAVFQRLAVAEGKIHGQPPDAVHFHEVGAVDSIVDIVGACIALELLGKPRVRAAEVVEGNGWVNCAHGRMPIPAPATLALLAARQVTVTQCEEPHELVTPTGAALLAEFAESFGPMNHLAAEKVGYGLGTRANQTRPNLLRAILGTETRVEQPMARPTSRLDWETDCVAVLETNIDDLNAEILGQFIETALAAGALDVFYTPIQMKKSRPGVLLTVLCDQEKLEILAERMLRETSAFGVRYHLVERLKLRREFTKVTTPYGEVTVKRGSLNGEVVQSAPEFESCRELARQAGVPVKQIFEAAIRASETKA